MAQAQIARDSFARSTLMRESMPNTEHYRRFTQQPSGRCVWCGSTPKTLYAYYWAPDSLRQSSWSAMRAQWFCSIGCARCYGSI